MKAAARAVALAAALAAVLWPAPSPGPGGADLEAFGRLPVLNEGRVKPLETVARSSLLALRGRQTVRAGGRTLGAVEWLLDALARPEAADGYPLFRVEDSQLLGMLGRDTPEPHDFSFVQLVPAAPGIDAMARRFSMLEASKRSGFENSIVNLDERLRLYDRLSRTLGVPAGELADGKLSPAALYAQLRRTADDAVFRPVPPAAGGGPEGWLDEGSALIDAAHGQPRPGALEYARLAASWNKGDAEAFNAVVAELAAGAQAAAPAETRRARWEALFDRSEPFYSGMIVYVLVLLLSLAALSNSLRPRVSGPLYFLLWLAVLAHTAGLAARVLLQGRPPVTNLYSSAVFVGWVAAVLGLVFERSRRDGLGALAASVVGFSTLVIAHNLAAQGDTMEMMRAVLDSNFWLTTHVLTVTVGYGAMFAAAALAHVFIVRRFLFPRRDLSLDRPVVSLVYGALCAGLFFSFLGTVLGGIWADHSWGRFWGWDPKENGALLIVLWAAIALHARWGGYARERGLAVMAVLGGALTSLSWFGVNMLGVGLHSYGFMEHGVRWLAAYCGLELLVAALAFVPPDIAAGGAGPQAGGRARGRRAARQENLV